MTNGYCDMCDLKPTCTTPCRFVVAELWRVENGRKRHRIEIVLTSELSEKSLIQYDNKVYGAGGE